MGKGTKAHPYYERVERLCSDKGISRRELAQAIEFSYTTLMGKWGETTPHNTGIVVAISDFFHVTTDYLLKGSNDEPLNPALREIMNLLRPLPSKYLERLYARIEDIIDTKMPEAKEIIESASEKQDVEELPAAGK